MAQDSRSLIRGAPGKVLGTHPNGWTCFRAHFGLHTFPKLCWCIGVQLPREILLLRCIAPVALLKTEADASTVLAIVTPWRYPKTSVSIRQTQVNNVRPFYLFSLVAVSTASL